MSRADDIRDLGCLVCWLAAAPEAMRVARAAALAAAGTGDVLGVLVIREAAVALAARHLCLGAGRLEHLLRVHGRNLRDVFERARRGERGELRQRA